jgi:hypothetical protein
LSKTRTVVLAAKTRGDVALRRLTTARLEPGTGYLLRNATASVIAELTEFEITRLGGCLGERDSRLVLTVDPRVRLPEALLDRYTADIGDPPPAGDVLAAHLRRRLQARDPKGVRTEETLSDPTVVDTLTNSAGREDRVARAASFARILADAEHAGDFDLTKIAEQLGRISSTSRWWSSQRIRVPLPHTCSSAPADYLVRAAQAAC